MASLNRKSRQRLVERSWPRMVGPLASPEEDDYEGVALDAEENQIREWWRCWPGDCICQRCEELLLDELDYLLWVEEVRPWVKHGHNSVMDLLEELGVLE